MLLEWYDVISDMTLVMMGYVRLVGYKDKLFLTLCNLSVIFSFVINNYNVNNKQWKLQNIGNSLKYIKIYLYYSDYSYCFCVKYGVW